jgi:non-ribosomal peptide synthetase component F
VKGADYVDLTSDDVFLHLAPLSFDASTFEIWGRIAQWSEAGHLSGWSARSIQPQAHYLAGWRQRAVADSRTCFINGLTRISRAITCVKQLLAGGDVLSVPHVRKVIEAQAGCRLINGTALPKGPPSAPASE